MPCVMKTQMRGIPNNCPRLLVDVYLDLGRLAALWPVAVVLSFPLSGSGTEIDERTEDEDNKDARHHRAGMFKKTEQVHWMGFSLQWVTGFSVYNFAPCILLHAIIMSVDQKKPPPAFRSILFWTHFCSSQLGGAQWFGPQPFSYLKQST